MNSRPAAIGSQEAGFTQLRAHGPHGDLLTAHLCMCLILLHNSNLNIYFPSIFRGTTVTLPIFSGTRTGAASSARLTRRSRSRTRAWSTIRSRSVKWSRVSEKCLKRCCNAGNTYWLASIFQVYPLRALRIAFSNCGPTMECLTSLSIRR